jgi:uncharacterized protein YjbJ (UPF0337 family)
MKPEPRRLILLFSLIRQFDQAHLRKAKWRPREQVPPRGRLITTSRATERPPCSAAKRKDIAMNWDRIEGNWKQFRGQVQQQWGKLTNDDLDTVEGRRVELVGKIQERYGIAKDEAEKQVDSWIGNM